MTNMRHGLPRLSNPELNGLSRVFGAGWAVRLNQVKRFDSAKLGDSVQAAWPGRKIRDGRVGPRVVFGKRSERAGRESGANGQAGR